MQPSLGYRSTPNSDYLCLQYKNTQTEWHKYFYWNYLPWSLCEMQSRQTGKKQTNKHNDPLQLSQLWFCGWSAKGDSSGQIDSRQIFLFVFINFLCKYWLYHFQNKQTQIMWLFVAHTTENQFDDNIIFFLKIIIVVSFDRIIESQRHSMNMII